MGLRAIWSAPDQTSQANTNDERAEKEMARVSVRANWVPPTPPHPPSIIGINSNVVIYINKFGGAMARKRLSETSICQRLPKVVFQQLRNRLWRRTQF